MREKKFTLHSIAGYTMEIAIWKMLCNVCKDLNENKEKLKEMFCVFPGMIYIEGEDFYIIEDSLCQEEKKKFYPPEIGAEYDKNKEKDLSFVLNSAEEKNEKAVVWCLGALVCYMSSGHYVFGGRGGEYQLRHPMVGLPVLRKEHEKLTEIVHQCMEYNPSERVSLKELESLSKKGYEKCLEEINSFPLVEEYENKNEEKKVISDTFIFWPEEMKE